MNTAGIIGLACRRNKPSSSEGEAAVRGSIYQEMFVLPAMPPRQVLCQEGSYFVATTPTPGTALAGPINATYDATKSWIAIKNNAATSTGKVVYPDYIKLIVTIAPASGTNCKFAIFNEASQAKYTSGGTEYTPRNTNRNSDESPVSTVIGCSGGTVLVTVASTIGPCAVGCLRSVIPAVNDEMIIAFGAGYSGGSSGTAAGRSCVIVPPMGIAPQGILLLNLYMASNAVTGMSYELEVGLWER